MFTPTPEDIRHNCETKWKVQRSRVEEETRERVGVDKENIAGRYRSDLPGPAVLPPMRMRIPTF